MRLGVGRDDGQLETAEQPDLVLIKGNRERRRRRCEVHADAAVPAAARNDSVSVAYMTLTFNKEPDVLFLRPASPHGRSSFGTSASEIEVLRLSFLPRGFESAQL